MNKHHRIKTKLMRYCSFIFSALLIFVLGCQKQNYTMDDYYNVEKIDVHTHLNTDNSAWIELAKKDNFKLLSINVDYSDFNPSEEQYKYAVKHLKENPETFAFASSFHMAGWDEPDWVDKVIKHLDSTFADGAVAVKVWKNIGMEFRDKGGNLVMIDNPKFDPIFRHIKDKGIILIGHLGEPKDCWLPIDEMMNNDMKDYFSTHPQYYMYQHPEMPTYEEQIAARDRMLDKNPELPFMGAHLGSLEWSLDQLADFFDKYPQAVVDMAARMGHIQYHAATDREKTRDFFIKYQDRILYATDNVQDTEYYTAEFKNEVHKRWISDWKFLVTDSTMRVADVDMPFKGLALPKEVIDKIYRKNAEALFNKAWQG